MPAALRLVGGRDYAGPRFTAYDFLPRPGNPGPAHAAVLACPLAHGQTVHDALFGLHAGLDLPESVTRDLGLAGIAVNVQPEDWPGVVGYIHALGLLLLRFPSLSVHQNTLAQFPGLRLPGDTPRA